MFNAGQSPASIFNPIHSNRLNYELPSEPSTPAVSGKTLKTLVSYQKIDGWGPTWPSFFWYDNNKNFSITQLCSTAFSLQRKYLAAENKCQSIF